jgi:hypothetical protein
MLRNQHLMLSDSRGNDGTVFDRFDHLIEFANEFEWMDEVVGRFPVEIREGVLFFPFLDLPQPT